MLDNAADTLKVDAAMLEAWRSDSDYDYAREMVPSDMSLSEWIYNCIDKFFYSIFGSDFYTDNMTFIWTSVGVVCVLAVIMFIYRKHPALFGRSGKVETEYDVTEDTIYGIDFPAEISAAMQRCDYRAAVRLIYLHALKVLTDLGLIDWQPCKTPTQYAAEVGTSGFRAFSNRFLRVRYGNFAATRELAEEMLAMRDAIINDGKEKGGMR